MENIDSKVSELLNKVNFEKNVVNGLKSAVTKSWITTCTIGFDSTATKINIQTTKEDALIDILAKLVTLSAGHNSACDLLGISKEFIYQGYKFDAWMSDINKRIKLLELKTKESNLEIIESKLDTLVSPEKRREMELELIEQMMKNL